MVKFKHLILPALIFFALTPLAEWLFQQVNSFAGVCVWVIQIIIALVVIRLWAKHA